MKLKNRAITKFAFTLAELLITLTIIGVVAALVIPSMLEEHYDKVWSTAKNLWEKKLVEVTRQMNVDGVMTGVAKSSEDYMNYFKKYVKIIKVCDNSELENCYSPEFFRTSGGEISTNKLKSSEDLGHKDWGTNLIGFVVADGTTGIMAYNPNCESVDPFSPAGQSGQVGCMGILLDVNGKDLPNRIGDDIMLTNAVVSTCDIKLGDLCLAGADITSVPPANTCAVSGDDPTSGGPNCDLNYWAGAQKTCKDLGMRVPTLQELANIATYLYGLDSYPIGANDVRSDVSYDTARVNELGWSDNGALGSYNYWSSQYSATSPQYAADAREFNSSFTRVQWHNLWDSSVRVRCVR